MKALLFVPLLLVSNAFADEAADRVAIGHSIMALNEPTQINALFTGDGRSEYERLREANPVGFRIIAPAANPVRPTVTISHEPWGEATINFQNAHPSVAFITPDVALAEGACGYQDSKATMHTTSLLFVMKKVGDAWKIASIRVLAV